MSQYDLLHRLQLFRDRGQPPGNHPQSVVDSHGVIRSTGGRTSPLTEAETSRVRRALFGPVDHAENLRFVQQELARGQREAEKRWNYDFVNDRPVNDPNRRYVWESMESQSRRQTPQIATLASSSDAEERSGTIINITAASAVSDNIKETVQSDNIASIEQIGNEKSEKSQGCTMSEKNLPSRPNPLICPPNTKSHPSSLQGNQSSITLSAPATACGTPHQSPHAGSTKTGSQIIPTSKSEAEVCDNPAPKSADRILTAAASSLASSSKSSKSCTSICSFTFYDHQSKVTANCHISF